jgi:hypothetical protein
MALRLCSFFLKRTMRTIMIMMMHMMAVTEAQRAVELYMSDNRWAESG